MASPRPIARQAGAAGLATPCRVFFPRLGAAPRPAHWLALALVVVLAGTLRFADQGRRPNGLFCDEAEKGYNAWSLAKTGGAVDVTIPEGQKRPRVEWRRLPWQIDFFGVHTSAIYQYVSVPFMWAEGLTIASTRRAAALAGTLAVALAGALLMRAWGAWEGLASAFFLAVSLWHLTFSRWAAQGIFVPLFMFAVLAGLWGLERRRPWGAPVAGAGLGWLFYCYSGAQPLALAWGACLAVIYWRELWSRRALRSRAFWIAAAMFLMPFVPTFADMVAPGGSKRMNQIAIWSNPSLSWPSVATVFMNNYAKHFDGLFLIEFGDFNERHDLLEQGMLTWGDVILWLVGMAWMFGRRAPLRWALASALFCAPIPAALTNDGVPHALRSLGMVVPIVAFAGYGLVACGGWACAWLQGLEGGRPTIAALMTWPFALIACALPMQRVAAYWRAAASPVTCETAFNRDEFYNWTLLAREWRPGQRVYVNGDLRYSVYYRMFCFKSPPRPAAPGEPAMDGVEYYDPAKQSSETIKAALKPGDWWIDLEWTPMLRRLPGPDGAVRRVAEAARSITF